MIIHNANLLPEGKTCPLVKGKRVVYVMGANIDEAGRRFRVLLEDGGQDLIPDSELIDLPKET